MISAIPSAGIPTDTSTSIRMAIPPLGIPGVPIDETVVSTTIESICVRVRSIPMTCATKTVAMAW